MIPEDQATRVRKVLVFRPGAIGDVLLTVPALRAIATACSGADITLICRPDVGELLENDCVAETHSLDEPRWIPFFGKDIRRALAEENADLVVFFQRGAGSETTSAMLESPVLQIDTAPESGRPFYETLCRRVWATGIRGSPSFAPIHVQSGFRDIRPENHVLPTDSSVVCLHVGSGSPHKNWPLERFRGLAEILRGSGFAPFLLCGPAEQEKGVTPPANDGRVPVVVNPRLKDLAAFMQKRAALLVGNDSGICHLGAALGVTTLVLFGPTDAKVWQPWGPKVHTIQGRCSKGPCGLEKARTCPDKNCLKDISVDQVAEEAWRLLRS